MKDVVITIVCVIILAVVGYFGTNAVVEHQQNAALPAAMPLPAKLGETATAKEHADYDKASAEVTKRAKAISDQQAIDLKARQKDAIIGGVVGLVIGLGLGVLVASKTSKKPAAA